MGLEMFGDTNSCHQHDPEEGCNYCAFLFWLSIGSPHVAVRLTSPKSVGLWNSVTILEFTILEIEFSQAMFVLRFIVAIISITIFTFHVYYCCCTVPVDTVPKSSPYLQVKLDHWYRICKDSTTSSVIRH